MESTEPPVRGELWLASLGAAKPGEPGKTRPALVLTPAEMLIGSPAELISVVPLSSSLPAGALSPPIRSNELDASSVAVVRAVRGVARKRLVQKIGTATEREIQHVEQALLVALGIAR